MILIIPEIELREGLCTYSIQGEKGTEALYSGLSQNPLKLCQLWRRENARTLHITDYDSYLNNINNSDSILFLAESLDIPVQVLSDFRSVNECRYFLENGIYRIIISRLAYTESADVKKLLEEYTESRIVFSLWTINGIVEFKENNIKVSDFEYIEYIQHLGASRLVYAEKNWIKSETGPNYEKLKQIAIESSLRITLFGSISSPQQLWELQTLSEYGVDSVIIGKALYENRFPCQKIWRKIEAQLE